MPRLDWHGCCNSATENGNFGESEMKMLVASLLLILVTSSQYGCRTLVAGGVGAAVGAAAERERQEDEREERERRRD